MRDNRLISSRSVATVDQILVPETLLKKRKSQEKAREERSAELEKKKKVCLNFSYIHRWHWSTTMMHNTIFATRYFGIDVVAN
jgi:hypothetical protein